LCAPGVYYVYNWNWPNKPDAALLRTCCAGLPGSEYNENWIIVAR
jgi:hypothetical protein